MPSETFVRELFAVVKERRSFGQHPLWLKLADGKVSAAGMRVFAAQFSPPRCASSRAPSARCIRDAPIRASA